MFHPTAITGGYAVRSCLLKFRKANFVYLQGIQDVLLKFLTYSVHFGYPTAPLGNVASSNNEVKANGRC